MSNTPTSWNVLKNTSNFGEYNTSTLKKKEKKKRKEKYENMKYNETCQKDIGQNKNFEKSLTASKSPKQASKLVGKNFGDEG